MNIYTYIEEGFLLKEEVKIKGKMRKGMQVFINTGIVPKGKEGEIWVRFLKLVIC